MTPRPGKSRGFLVAELALALSLVGLVAYGATTAIPSIERLCVGTSGKGPHQGSPNWGGVERFVCTAISSSDPPEYRYVRGPLP